jgi:hypothetical protein
MKKWIDKGFSVCKSTTYISKLKGFDWTPKMFSSKAERIETKTIIFVTGKTYVFIPIKRFYE